MKILIAGGAGYLGSVLVPRLLEHGHEIDVVDLLWFGSHLPDSVNVIQKDIKDLIADDLIGYDQVIFLAGLSNDPMAEYSPSRNFIENGAVPTYLSYISKEAGVKRYIYGGSCSIYGYTVNELYDETSPTIPSYPYGISKLQGEFGSMQLMDKNFSVICFRQGTISGYSPRMRLDLIVNTMFKCAINDKKIIVNNPAIWRPILAIQDAASAYVRAVESNSNISGIFNIASGNYTVGEVADNVKECIKKSLKIDTQLVIKDIQDFRNYKVSCVQAKNILGFRSVYNIEKIVAELVMHLDKFSDFGNKSYYNIEAFKAQDNN